MSRTAQEPAVRLSVIVITKNEAAHIAACLESVAFADQIVVLDSGSTDDTPELARRAGAQVHHTADWPGFGPQKNRALDLADGDWVLSLDADERVPPELADEIRRVVAAPARDGYEIARLSDFCGSPIRHSGWWPDYVLRLFRRGAARFSDDAVHERVVLNGEAGRLRGHLRHYPYADLETLVAKINRYSTDAAAMMYRRGKRAGALAAVGHGFWTFVRIYLIRRGFLDGRRGLVLAGAAAAGSFFRYAKLMLLSQGATGNKEHP